MLGYHLRDGDSLAILDTCGFDFAAVPRWGSPVHGVRSLGATDDGASFSWNDSFVSAPGGEYRLCWCAAGYECTEPHDYHVDFGTLELAGPSP